MLLEFLPEFVVQHAPATIYYDYVVDKDTEHCFLLSQDTKQSLKMKDAPLVIFLSSMIPSHFASV